MKLVKGSLTREGFSTVPNVTWGDVGGLDHLRLELNNYIVRPIKNPEIYKVVIKPLPPLHSLVPLVSEMNVSLWILSRLLERA